MSESIRYTRPDDFPTYLWIEGEPPDGLVYTPDLGAMREFVERNVKRPRLMAKLRDRVHLLEAFIDIRHRERAGLTLDQIREIWHGKPDAPASGAV